MRITIMDFEGRRAWQANVSDSWLRRHYKLRRHYNDHVVSIGYVLGEDITQRSLDSLLLRKQAQEVDYERVNHGGCQSACRLRGAQTCQW